MRQPIIICLAILALSGPHGAAQRATVPPSGVIASKFAGPMIAVGRSIIEDRWNPILDRTVQNSPAAQGLGRAWSPSDARWQKARKALGARVTRLMAAYATSGEVKKYIDADLGRIGPGPELDVAIAALNGPAGDAIVRSETSTQFIVATMSETPNGPAIASPEWLAQLTALTKTFNETLGAAMPKDDGTHAAELEQMARGPVHSLLQRVCGFAVSNVTRQLQTAINLMLLDDMDAINRDVADAVAGR
jgi:hypothetical protein